MPDLPVSDRGRHAFRGIHGFRWVHAEFALGRGMVLFGSPSPGGGVLDEGPPTQGALIEGDDRRAGPR